MKVKIVRPSKEICVFASCSRFCPLFCLSMIDGVFASFNRKKIAKIQFFFSTYYERKFKESLNFVDKYHLT